MSKIEVNAIEPQCGTNLTVGASGDTITFPSGTTVVNNGSQTGFGREGSVDWQTSIKTATFTAASGEGYFCNTSGGAFTVNLPSSPSVGDIVAIKDYAGTFDSNNLTIGRGGSNMNGDATDSARTTANESLTLVYADATKGWLAVEEGTGYVGESFITATGGTITTCGNCKIHTFTGPGTFTVSGTAACATNNIVSHLVVAGGGAGGGAYIAGGGGAGGFREVKNPVTPYTASPLDGYPSAPNRITVTAQSYPITVGSGGTGNASAGATDSTPGNNSTFSTITSAGGGYGKQHQSNPSNPGGAGPGGSGGGGNGGGPGSNPSPNNNAAGTGNAPPVSPSQGNNGGTGTPSSPNQGAGGGGGATAVGGNGASTSGGNGGAGATTNISGSPTAYAGGGGGNSYNGGTQGTGGTGGGGNANQGNGSGPSYYGQAGTANTGGGGGGTDSRPGLNSGGNGGSGVVIIRYKFQ